jgi:hypothetical protein
LDLKGDNMPTPPFYVKAKQVAMIDAYDYIAGCSSELGSEWLNFPLQRYPDDQQLQAYYESHFLAYLQELRNVPKLIW